MCNTRNKRRAVLPEHVPCFLATVCDGPSALTALESEDLLSALQKWGLAETVAKTRLEEDAQRLKTDPRDAKMVVQLRTLFDRPLEAQLRMMRVHNTDEGASASSSSAQPTVLVIAVIDLVMLAKGCDYETAKKVVQRIFAEYYDVTLDEVCNNFVDSGTICPRFHKVRFPGCRGAESLAAGIQDAAEILCLIPGSEVGSTLRRKAIDIMLRVEGGDESLIDRITANAKFQRYLAEHDPDHPFRATVGEYAERRHDEEADRERKRRADIEAGIHDTHKRRLLDLEYERACLELQAYKEQLALRTQMDAEKLEHQKQQGRIETERRRAELEVTKAATHESFRRERAQTILVCTEARKVVKDSDMSPRTKRCADDVLLTGILGQERADPELGAPVYLTDFLAKKLHLKEWAARERAKVFGKKVKAFVKERFPDYDGTTNRTIDGVERQVHLYFEAHLGAIEAAFEDYKTNSMKPIDDAELTRKGLELRRSSAAAAASEAPARAAPTLLQRFFMNGCASGSSSQ